MPVQINGKVRDRVTVPAGISQIELEQIVLARDRVQELLAGREPQRIIHAGGGRLVNIVVRELRTSRLAHLQSSGLAA